MSNDYDLVMRSVYLKPSEDAALRQLAFDLNVTKSDLIRSAIGAKLREWLKSNSRDLVLQDLEYGLRNSNAAKAVTAVTAAPSPLKPAKPSKIVEVETAQRRRRVAAAAADI